MINVCCIFLIDDIMYNFHRAFDISSLFHSYVLLICLDFLCTWWYPITSTWPQYNGLHQGDTRSVKRSRVRQSAGLGDYVE